MMGTPPAVPLPLRSRRRSRSGTLKSLRPLLIALVVLAFWPATARPALAHAVLERSDPPPNATLETPPTQIVLRFSEAVDPAFSTATLVDRGGRGRSSPSAVSADRRSIVVRPEHLEGGVYVVRWRVLSRVDGHTTSGVLVFGVGQAVPGEPAAPESGGPAPLLILARWSAYAAALLLAGTVFFPLFVLRGLTLPPAAGGDPVPIRRLQVSAGVLLLAGSLVEFMVNAGSLLALPVRQAVAQGTFWSFLTGTRPGWSLLGRTLAGILVMLPDTRVGRILRIVVLILAAGLGGLAALLGGPASLTGPGHAPHLIGIFVVAGVFGIRNAVSAPPGVDWVPVIPAAGLLAAFTLASHAAGRGLVAFAVDWIHLSAGSIWVGGLAILLLLMRRAPAADRPAFVVAVVPRFSRIAGYALGALVLTGVYSSWLHVPALRAFVATAYGRLLLLKLGLVAGLAGLGAVNRFVLRPRLARAETLAPAARWLSRSIGGEVIVAGAVLLVVAALTITPPASVTTPGSTLLAVSGLAGGFRVDLTITTLRPGWSRYEIGIRDESGRPPEREALVLLRLLKLDEDIRPLTVRPAMGKPGLYTIEGGELALPRWWEISVIIRRAGHLDETTSLPLLIPGAPRRSADLQAVLILDGARAATRRLTAWREVQQLTTGPGEVVVSQFSVQPPDRLQYKTSSGSEAVIIGTDRYTRDAGGPWTRDTLPQPITAEGPLIYMDTVRQATRGRQDACGEERCQAVFWEAAGSEFAGWIGLSTGRMYRLMMIAPGHFMTIDWGDFDSPIRIVPP